jgi:hypothetical protein
MIRILPKPYSELRKQLGNSLEGILDLNEMSYAIESQVADREIPFVELSYDEISTELIEEVLGYAAISRANTPIGIDRQIEPVLIGNGLDTGTLLFPLDGLEANLRASNQLLANEFADAGNMDGFAETRGENMSAKEYLVCGLLECINFCKQQRYFLAFSW